MAKLIKKPYDFTDDNGKQITGHAYYVQVVTSLGTVDFKVIAKGDLERKVLETEIEKQK